MDEELSGIHAGIDLVRAGLRLLSTEQLTADQTQTIVAALAGFEDASVLDLLVATIKRLTHSDTNPSLDGIGPARAIRAQDMGEVFAHEVAVSGLRAIACEISAAVDVYAPEPDKH